MALWEVAAPRRAIPIEGRALVQQALSTGKPPCGAGRGPITNIDCESEIISASGEVAEAMGIAAAVLDHLRGVACLRSTVLERRSAVSGLSIMRPLAPTRAGPLPLLA